MGSKEPEGENMYAENLSTSRERANDLEKNVEEIQSAKYGSALLRLMERTKDNTEIINNLNEFLDALEHQSQHGDSGQGLSESRQKELADFFAEAAKALRWKVGGGNRPADLKVNLSRWEEK